MQSIENLKALKHHTFLKRISFICINCNNEDKKTFKKEESIEMLKILDLIINIEKYQMNI